MVYWKPVKPSFLYEGTGQQMVSLSMSASKVYLAYSKSVVVNQEALADVQDDFKLC